MKIFAPGTRIIVEGSSLRWRRRLPKDRVFSVSRSLGWIVLYDRDFKTPAKVDSYLEEKDPSVKSIL